MRWERTTRSERSGRRKREEDSGNGGVGGGGRGRRGQGQEETTVVGVIVGVRVSGGREGEEARAVREEKRRRIAGMEESGEEGLVAEDSGNGKDDDGRR